MVKRFKSLLFLTILIAVLPGCNDSVEQIDSETLSNEESVQFILSQSIMPTELTVVTENETIQTTRTNNHWQSEELAQADERAIAYFLEDLRGLKGKRVERDLETPEDLSIHLADGEYNIEILLWNNEEEAIVQVNDVNYQVEQLPASLSSFNKIFLEPAIELNTDSVEEILFSDDEEEISLNQTTEMLEVERIPFISGWYLHGPYETDFSIEFNWMGQLLSSFIRLHGVETEQEIESIVQTIEINSSESSETIHVGNVNEEGFSLIKVERQDQHYLVPTQLIDYYQFEPLSIVDNFVALIPLDAVEKIEIDDGTDHFMIEVERDFLLDDDDEVTVEYLFYFNNEEIEENVMRRAYQYLARLSYHSELTDEYESLRSDNNVVDLTYYYINEGENRQKIIKLYPITDTTSYIVENDGVEEFILTDERLNDLFDAFRALE